MAYVLDRKVVKDTKEFNDFAYGITLPVQRGNGGYFNQAFSSFDQAKSNLKNLLLTNKGERIMQPNFGTGLQALLFEQLDAEFESKLEETITKNVNYWLPYINIQQIDIEMTDEMKDRNIANMSIQFTVGNQINTEEITFTIRG
jgi:phage baseplate assembly protein W